MNKYIRKSLALIVILAILLTAFSGMALAAPRVIDQTVNKQTITSGVTLENHNIFTTSGWVSSNVLRVDLSNENVKVDSLINKKSTVERSSVRNLAKNSGAIAAVNAGFFDYGSGNNGYVYGPVMSSGKFDLAATRNSDDTATFSLDKLNNTLYSYWDTKVDLITPSGERKMVATYNRYNGNFNGMQIVDTKWGAYTPGFTKNYEDWLEMIVEDGVVKEFSENKPGVKIPENGFVVLGTGSQSKYLLDNFKIGDAVQYEITMNVDASNLKMALTGGSLLVKDSSIVSKFTLSPGGSARAARTAVGTSEDGKTLFVVTVDGKSSRSIGMTQYEIAEYMMELGCANAINMDGGGSTNMVARESGTTGLSSVNTPSDGYERPITSALGIFSIAPTGPVDTLVVKSYEDNVFVNTSRAFSVRGLDKYMNPVNINPDAVKWSVKGVTGTFKSNVFYPTSAGKAVVTAKLGDDVVGTCPITVLSTPAKLELNIDSLNTKPGAKTFFSIKGWDKDGYTASIPPANIKWSVVGNVGTMSASTFTAGKSGTGSVSASVGKTTVSCPVSILQSGIQKVIENFDSNGLKLETSSKSVSAKYSPATNVYKSKKYSAKITYDFTKDLKNNRAAYLNLPNGGYTLDSSTSKLGVWVYSSAKRPVWIGATVYDSKGNFKSEYFAKDINWTGWKYLEVSLDDVNNPKKITNLFLVQPTKKKANGTVYFDNLTMVYTGYPDVNMSNIAKTTVPADTSYKERSVSGSDSMSFSVFGQSNVYTANDKTQISMLNSLAARVNKYMQASVLVGSNDGLSRSSIKIPQLATTASYKSLDKNGNRLIQLNTSKGGLRLTDSDEWFWFKDQVNSFKGNNLFVFVEQSPDSFRDTHEGALLKDTLTAFHEKTGKNVWVFYNGSTNRSYIEKGVKYISTAGFDSPGFSDSNRSAAKFCVVKVKGTSITYQFNSF